jgi:cell division protein FtsB
MVKTIIESEITKTFSNFKPLTIDLSQKDTQFEFPENNTICICNYQNKKKFLNSIVTNETAIIGKDFYGKNIKNIIDSTYLNQNLSDIEKNIESFFLETEKSTKRSQLTELLHSKCIYICYTKSEKEKKKYKEMSYQFQEKNPWLQLDLLELVDILQQKKIENPINIVNIVIDNSNNTNITNVDRILSLEKENLSLEEENLSLEEEITLLKKRIEYLEEQTAKKKRK